MRKADATALSFARDGSENVRAEVSSTGAVVAAFRYRAYGQLARSTVAAPSHLGLASQLLDPPVCTTCGRTGTSRRQGRFISRKRTSAGTWLTPNVKVSDGPGGGGGAVQRNPRIAGKADGAQTAVWVDLRSSQNNIYSSTLPVGGATWAVNSTS